MKNVFVSAAFCLVGALKIIGSLLILTYHTCGYSTEVTVPPIELLRFVCEERADKLTELHESLLKTLLYREMLDDYDTIISVPIVDSNLNLPWVGSYWAILDLIVSEAKASGAKLYCNFGGWPSLINKRSKKCMEPWNSAVKENSYIKKLGSVYSGSNYRCGKPNLFRCNPVIFGAGEQSKYGMCVKVSKEVPQMVMRACMEAHTSNKDEHIEKLKKDPKLLAKYLGVAAETIRYCKKEGRRNAYCPKFIETTRSVANSSLCCDNEKEVLPYLPSVHTPDNFKVIDEITKGLLTKYAEEFKELQRIQAEKDKEDENYYKDQIAAYSSSSGVKKMIGRINRNSTRCIQDACRGRKKASGKSTAYCLRYVKHGLIGGGFVRDYPRVGAAKNFGPVLEGMGFVNLRTIDEFRGLGVKQAPKGAIIVYKGGDYGHIEVKMGGGKYGSDHIATRPISSYLDRTVIGIYVKIKKKEEND